METVTQEQPRISENLEDFGNSFIKVMNRLDSANRCIRENQVRAAISSIRTALDVQNHYITRHQLKKHYKPLLELMDETIAQGIIEIGNNLTNLYQGEQK